MLSPDIFEARRGNITASSAHRMMAGWEAPKPPSDYPIPIYQWIEDNASKPLVGALKADGIIATGKEIDAAWKAYQFDQPPQGLLTYAEDLACDELFDYDPSTNFTSLHMENGNDRELKAVEQLSDETGLVFSKTGEDQIHIGAHWIGATPDGIVYDDLDLIETGCEVKCRTPLHHARQLLINDNESLKEHDFERYCQIQVACHVTGAQHWYSANFNPFAKSDAHKLHYCVIERDDEFLEIFKQRAAVVFEHKQRFLDELNKLKEPMEQAA